METDPSSRRHRVDGDVKSPPVYFRKPFEEREILIVYNATILGILVLLTMVVSGPSGTLSNGQRSLLGYAVLALAALTLVLNLYALAAVTARTLDAGLTANRFAVIGWNVTTFLMLVAGGIRQWVNRRSLPPHTALRTTPHGRPSLTKHMSSRKKMLILVIRCSDRRSSRPLRRAPLLIS